MTGDLTHDAFLCGKLHLWQPKQGYRAATDAVLLAAACPAKAGESVLDLGCGVGAASLCLASRVAGLVQTGLELQEDYAALARQNAAENGVALNVVMGDLTAMPAALRVGFDHVIANPPWYPRGGSPSPILGRDTALRAELPLAEWVAAAATGRLADDDLWHRWLARGSGLPWSPPWVCCGASPSRARRAACAAGDLARTQGRAGGVSAACALGHASRCST